MPNWRKIILSGSTANLNSLTVTNGITGSLFGTASYISPTFISASVASFGFGAGTSVSASYAATASLVNGNVNVTQAIIGNTIYATISTTAGAGTTSIYTVSNTTYSSIFVDYSINGGTTDARAGSIQVVSVGTDISFTETTTMDIGSTNDISWNVYLNGADINFDIVNAGGSSWTVKFSSRQM